jgi:hypothetical protein
MANAVKIDKNSFWSGVIMCVIADTFNAQGVSMIFSSMNFMFRGISSVCPHGLPEILLPELLVTQVLCLFN